MSAAPPPLFPRAASSRRHPSHPPRRPWHRLARAVSWHRRGLAAVAAVLAVLAGVSAARPEGPPQVQAVVLRDELAGGTVVTADHLQLRAIAATDAPAGSLGAVDRVVGRTLAAPAAAGQVLTELALVSPRVAVAAGHVVAPLRLADAGLVRLLRAGDLVDVLAAEEQSGRARVVASSARVVTVPAPDEAAAAETSGALVLVEATPAVATALAQAAATGSLSVTWR